MKKITILVIVMCVFTISFFSSSLQEIQKKGVLVMGTEATFPPFEFVNEQNQIVGFDVEIGKSIADKLGVKLEVKDMAFDGLLPALNSGKFDIIIAGMTITDERKKVVAFSEKYFDAGQAIVSNDKNKKFSSIEELKGKKVAVQAGTTGDLLVSEIDDIKVTRFSKFTEAFLELVLKRVDAVVIDYSAAEAYLKTNNKLYITSPMLSDESFGIAVKKDNMALLEIINEYICELKEDGYSQLYEKWFN